MDESLISIDTNKWNRDKILKYKYYAIMHGIGQIEINNRPMAVLSYWVVNSSCHGQQDKVCNLSWATGQSL